ncbi:hypothetical protein ACFV19_02020 [Streptomyces griseoluteus]|uniref:hypothetical protein n=1 Tax=Streptomyces griseoluteus TaxID=29306 RepID=UPI0036B1469F
MSKEIDQDWVAVLQRCGLQVVEDHAIDALPVNSAFYAVNGVDVEPVASIPFSSPEAMSGLSRLWHAHCSRLSLCGDDGEFLIMPPGAGGSKVGWVKVKDQVGIDLPSRIARVTGSPEFIATSLDGRRLCAVSVEDDEYWVVVHKFA